MEFFVIIATIFLVGLIIVTLVNVSKKSYKPRTELTAEEKADLFAYDASAFFSRFDHYLEGISVLLLIFLSVESLWFGGMANDSELISYLKLFSVIVIGLSMLILGIRIRLKNPLGRQITKQIKTKGDPIRIVYFSIMIFCLLAFLLLVLKYYDV